MIHREFTAIYQKRPHGYIAWIEEVPGANTQGKTKAEARENLKEALYLVLDANRKLAERRHEGMIMREPFLFALPA